MTCCMKSYYKGVCKKMRASPSMCYFLLVMVARLNISPLHGFNIRFYAVSQHFWVGNNTYGDITPHLL